MAMLFTLAVCLSLFTSAVAKDAVQPPCFYKDKDATSQDHDDHRPLSNSQDPPIIQSPAFDKMVATDEDSKSQSVDDRRPSSNSQVSIGTMTAIHGTPQKYKRYGEVETYGPELEEGSGGFPRDDWDETEDGDFDEDPDDESWIDAVDRRDNESEDGGGNKDNSTDTTDNNSEVVTENVGTESPFLLAVIVIIVIFVAAAIVVICYLKHRRKNRNFGQGRTTETNQHAGPEMRGLIYRPPAQGNGAAEVRRELRDWV